MDRRAFLATLAASALTAAPKRKTRNLIWVMADGLRWQEVFGGADEGCITKDNKVSEPAAFRKEFWRDDLKERRSLLMPFLWSTMADKGQIYGNRKAGSDAFVTNGKNFSYPGYSETLCGFADPRVDSNDKVPNPNVTVLEWLNRKRDFRGKVAAFGAWDVFPYILNAERSGMLVNAGFDPLTAIPESDALKLFNTLRDETRIWTDEAPDPVTFHAARMYMEAARPRVLFIGLGETDEWAHAGDYPQYLRAARLADKYLKAVWELSQELPEYRGNTTLVFSPDHGRGEAPTQWRNHGEKTPDSKYIWMAFLGPDTPARGERKDIAAVQQNQLAATVAALLGEDYAAVAPAVGQPIADVLPTGAA